MPERNEKAQALLEHQQKPALVLGPSGTIITANEGILRLFRFLQLETSSSSAPQTADSLIGTSISDSGLILQPGDRLPATWTWIDVLNAAHRNFHSHKCKGDHSSALAASGDHVSQVTDVFWDREAEQSSMVECDIFYAGSLRGGFNFTMPGPRSKASIQARASVYWCRCQGVFLVTLGRPCQRQQSETAVPLAMEHVHCDNNSSDPLSACSICTPSKTSTESDSASADITASLIPYIVATCSVDGLVTHFSKSWYRFSGLTEEQSLGAAWITAMHPDDVERTQSSWTEVLSKELPQWSTEARFRRASTGKYIWFLIRAQPQRDTTGKILRWYTSMMDIDEWVMARQEAERKRQSMIALFSNSDIMLWGVDKYGEVYLREGGLHWLPVDIAKLPGSSAQRLATTETSSAESSLSQERGRLGSALEAILYGSGSSPIVEHREGDRWFRTMFVAERGSSTTVDADGVTRPAARAALALTFEITDEKNQAILILENEKLAANEKAANEANELKSRFLANMSHEIRTPISGIIGLSEHLQACKLAKEPKNLAKDIHETAQFLLHLVNDILDLSKLDSGKMAIESISFSLDQVIRDTLVPLQFQADEKKIDLQWSCNIGTKDLLLGDPSRIRQILTNLLGNSLKFTNQGKVCLVVNGTPEQDTATVNVLFIVQDTGIGISEEAIGKLFDPFSQADTSTARMYGGTGLGLTICRDLSRLMGGEISLKSTPGQGTTVTCSIPFARQALSKDSRRFSRTFSADPTTGESNFDPTPPQSEGNLPQDAKDRQPPIAEALTTKAPKRLILIVDDNAINRKVNSLYVTKFGYDVAVACDGQEACHYLGKSSGKPRPDLVFMDCMMPVVDGYEATRRIRTDAEAFDERTRALPIIALTASALQSDRDRCWEAGMNDCIGRPVCGRELKVAIERWTAHHT